jgi:hypothetical protein
MSPNRAVEALALLAQSQNLPEDDIRRRVAGIHRDMLSHSRYVRHADFVTIAESDLEFLFDSYSRVFFAGLCRPALQGRRIDFRLASRMTKAGGKTSRILMRRTGEISYEIAIAHSILFDGFRGSDRQVTVCGLECANRLEALQRIFEHEMVHLIEQLCWGSSNCAMPRFQDIACRHFLHQSHTHKLVTRRERAAISGIRPGAMVTFQFESQQLSGRVNRVTKRATVLVEAADGRQYSDGKRYRTYYVPLGSLKLMEGVP